MIEGVVIKKLNKHELADERGWLLELWREDRTDYRPAMSYVSLTKPGKIRGPHEHKYQSDAFVFIGPGNFELHLWDNREESLNKGVYEKMLVGDDNPVMIIVPPGVVHGYKCLGDKEAWCFNFPDKLYGGAGKKEEVDEIRWEKEVKSPFVIK